VLPSRRYRTVAESRWRGNDIKNRYAFALILLMGVPCHGTTVVVLRDRQQIIIAADSGGWSPTSPTPLSICKIVSTHDVVFSSAGLLEDRPSKFDVTKIATQAFSENGSILQREATFSELISKPLLRAIWRIKRDTPKVFDTEIVGKPQALQVVFTGFENGRPIYVADFFSVRQRKGRISIRFSGNRCPGGCNDKGNSYLLMGEISAAQAKISAGSFWTSDLIRDARTLIDIEIAARPDNVSGPIDILRVSGEGLTWVQRKPDCKN